MRSAHAMPAVHAVALICLGLLWETAAAHGLINPVFFGRPSGIASYLWQGLVSTGKLWIDVAYTLGGALISFTLGSVAAVGSGMLFAVLPRLHRALEPYLTLLNAMPRIALLPLFLLWFGLGLGSKIAVGTSLTFFIVLSSTVVGMRSSSPDHVVLSRTLGATPFQIFCKVTLPTAVPVVFAGLRLGFIYALLGVVGAELIAAERGLGQALAYLQSTFNMDGVLGILLILALLGLAAVSGMDRIENKLLAWR